jgi:ATP adenylyltransferase
VSGDPDFPERGPDREDRLWTPWRMRYVGGQREAGCVFCNRLAETNDADSLILWRGERAFAIMNLFPYNTGHIMLVPNEHVSGPEEANPAALAEIATTLPAVLRALRRTLNCDGFNLGLNVGAIAGAGIAEHQHEHVVPRWTGDANFMPILAGTMVMPELIPVTYAKLRAEFARELGGCAAMPLGLVEPSHGMVHAGPEARLPMLYPDQEQPVWKSALAAARAIAPGIAGDLAWAGSPSATGAPALAVILDRTPPDLTGWVLPGQLADPGERLIAERAIAISRENRDEAPGS